MMRNRLFLVVLLVAALGAGVVAWLLFSPLTGRAERYLYINSPATASSVYAQLDTLAPGVRSSAFRALAELWGYSGRVREGRYEVSGHSVVGLLRDMRNGHQTPLRFHVPTVNLPANLASRLSKAFESDSVAFASAFADSSLCAQYGFAPQRLFCHVLPDTYELYWTISPEQFMKRMAAESDRYWTEERKRKAEAAGLTQEEAVILASIVEKETAANEEKPAIAGLYLNRLRTGMKLQADPTVKFAVGDFGLRRILGKHLATSSPYNTYLHEGLPPGPICLPSRESIEAVLNHDTHNYIYMCAKEDFSGRHNFAATYAEHQANARRYVEALNARGIK